MHFQYKAISVPKLCHQVTQWNSLSVFVRFLKNTLTVQAVLPENRHFFLDSFCTKLARTLLKSNRTEHYMQIFAHWAKKLDNNIRHFTHKILYEFCCLRHKNKLLTHSEITEICHNGFPFPSTYFNLSVWMEGSDPWSQIQNSKTSMYEFSFFL